MRERTFKIMRTLDKVECPWLSEIIEEGTIVFEFLGTTYGCISPGGIAVSIKPHTNPFFEVPLDSVETY